MSPQVALCEVGWRESNWGGFVAPGSHGARRDGSCCAGLALCKPGPSHAGPSPRQLVPEALAPVPRRTGPGPAPHRSRSRAAPVPVRAGTESASADPGPPRPGPRHILISTRPGLVREIAAQPASTSLNPRDRRVTREHVT